MHEVVHISCQWAVGSCQWVVDSGQWAVVSSPEGMSPEGNIQHLPFTISTLYSIIYNLISISNQGLRLSIRRGL